jgi:hypothetical protein
VFAVGWQYVEAVAEEWANNDWMERAGAAQHKHGVLRGLSEFAEEAMG